MGIFENWRSPIKFDQTKSNMENPKPSLDFQNIDLGILDQKMGSFEK